MKKTQILTGLSVHLSRSSEILFSTRSISSLLVLLVDGRDLKIQYHYKTTDRRICAATFLELSDEKVSSTEGEDRITFSNSDSMCLPSKGFSSGWAYGTTHTYTDNPPTL